jgi:hypothetical protein
MAPLGPEGLPLGLLPRMVASYAFGRAVIITFSMNSNQSRIDISHHFLVRDRKPC